MSKALRVFLALAIAYGWFVYRGANWNADSRLFLTYAIVDDHSLYIDRFSHATGDIAAYDGHFYTDKAPGLSFIAAAPYAVVRALGAAPATPDDFLMRQLLSWLTVGITTAATGAVLYAWLRRNHPRTAVWGTLLFGLGSLAWPYTTMLFSHQFAANLVLLALLLAIRGSALLVALLGAIAYTVEPPATLLWLFLAALALWKSRPWDRRTLLQIALGLVALAVALGLVAVYNASCFGSPFLSGYAHLAGPEEFRLGQAQGFYGYTTPTIESLFGMSFSFFRGLVWLMPVMLALPTALVVDRIPLNPGEDDLYIDRKSVE